ncbi:MAG: alkaline phosphatase D family protein [Myxococcales bacterium]|nr:alkaline phosphatase D family protein [Myxococcales bacterium]
MRRASALGIVGLATPTLVNCGKDDGEGTDSGTTGDASESESTTSGEDDGLPKYEFDGEPGPENLFSHGVASGDPLADSVILWTRVSPAGDDPIEVFYEVALDPEFAERVAAGYVMTDGARDFTVKLDTEAMTSSTSYYYRFKALGRSSPIGRTRTAAAGPWARLRFAVCSCSNYAYGYFTAYGGVAGRADLDAVLHLGDYIYEYGDGQYGSFRELDPPYEILTLEDYRRRYAHYRGDPHLQEAHRQHPFINVWDDHESANDAYNGGAENHDADEGPWPDRLAAAEQAYNEWLPTREGAPGIIYRTMRFGDLLDLIMLDTRIIGRDKQSPLPMEQNDPERTLLGPVQEAWLEEQLVSSTAKWRLIGQQVMMAPYRGPAGILNADQWDGYSAARDRFLEVIESNGIGNTVVLTGDIHSSWACDIPRDPMSYDAESGAGSVIVEFVTPSITSPGPGEDIAELVFAYNPHIRWGEGAKHGYLLLDVDEQRILGEWYHYASITIDGEIPGEFVRGFALEDGARHLVEVQSPSAPIAEAPPLAP